MFDEYTRRGVLRGTGGAIGVGLAADIAAGKSESNRPKGTDEVIVGTASRDATSYARSRATSIARVHEFGNIGEAVVGQWPDGAIAALERRPDVRYIEPNGLMEKSVHSARGSQSVPWGVDRVGGILAQHQGFSGQGVHVAILDSGIDSDHPDLQANLGAGRAFVECGTQSDGSPCSSTNGNTCLEAWDDDDDHGTHVAGTAAAVSNDEGVIGVAADAILHAIKVLDCNGVGTFSDIAAGLQFVADNNLEIANMSLGSSFDSQTVHDACKYVYRRGVTIVAAAGNSGPCSDCVSFPAAYREVIAVSATTRDDTLAGFSSTGPEIELAAPGRDIRSTVPGGYGTKSGTSMASPHVAGAAALLGPFGYPNATNISYNSNDRLTRASYDEPGGTRERLRKTAENVGLSANESGDGLLDAGSAVSIGEIGTLTVNQPDAGTWRTVALDNWYENPVVIAKPVSYRGSQPAHVRLRNVERGVRVPDRGVGLSRRCTHRRAAVLLRDGGGIVRRWERRSDRSEKRPSRRELHADAVHTGLREQAGRVLPRPDVKRRPADRYAPAGGLDERLWTPRPGGRALGPHATERVGYVAAEPGTNAISGTRFEIGRTPNTVTDGWYRIGFEKSYDPPLFLADAQSQDGSDTANLRYRNLTGSGVGVRVEEERSADAETDHTTEAVGYLVVESGGLI